MTMDMDATSSARVAALLSDYEASAIAWDAAQVDAAKANPLFDHLHHLFKELRGVEAGRQGIAALIAHSNVGVRLTAASHSLEWAPNEAVLALEGIERGPGLHAVSAKYTLKAFRDGTLNQDW
jgi:hypothetical protein